MTLTKKNIHFYIIFFLPWAFMLGLAIGDASRVLALILTGVFVFKRSWYFNDHDSTHIFSQSSSSTTKIERLLFYTALAMLLVITISAIVRVFVGHQGMDHAIFSQASNSFALGRGFYVTLNRSFPNNFLHDHLAPILSLSGALIYLGIPAHSVFILLQSTGLLVALFLLRRICLLKGLSPLASNLIVLIFMCNGDLRSQVTWGTQLEYIAIPFVLLATERYLSKKYWGAFLAACLAASCKETLLLWAGGFALMAVVVEWKKNLSLKENIISLIPFFILGVVSTVVFLVFTFGQGFIIGKNYDYMARISSPTHLVNLKTLSEKLFYLAHFFLYVFFYPLFTRSKLKYFIPILPFFLLTLVSNFSHMWELGRQYVAFPAVLIIIATVISLSKNEILEKFNILKVGALLMSIAFTMGFHRPIKPILYAIRDGLKTTTLLESLPKDAWIGVNWSSSLFLLDNPNIFYVKDVVSPWKEKLEFLAYSQDDITEEKITTIDGFHACREDKHWKIFCKNIPK